MMIRLKLGNKESPTLCLGMTDFPPQLKALFYAQFHPTLGPQVVSQVPSRSISPYSSSALFDVDAIRDYILPKRALCNRNIEISTQGFRIMGHPVCIEDARYDRNLLFFNFCFVFEDLSSVKGDNGVVEPPDLFCYRPVVLNTARTFSALERHSRFLSTGDVEGKVYKIIEQILEDLNSYCECMIPVTETQTISFKLFPTYPSPPLIRSHDVPLLTVQLESLMTEDWDLTLQKVIPYIDGVRSVKRVSEAANVEYILTRKCIEHLVYYGCLITIDIFQFSNSYSVTPKISLLISDEQTQKELRSYVIVRSTHNSRPLSAMQLIELYLKLERGKTLMQWVRENSSLICDLDIRRFITFGVIKGFLRRLHKYPIVSDYNQLLEESTLTRFVDGKHCLDEACVELQNSGPRVEELLRSEFKMVYELLR